MYWKRVFSLLFALVVGFVALTMWGADVVTAVPSAPSNSDFINIYQPDPINGSTPRQLIQEGNTFWFTDPGQNAIGKLVVTDTADFNFTFYPIETENSQPYDLVKDSDTIWFTQLAANKIGQLNTLTGVITDHVVPTVDSEPTGIDVATDGAVWFVQRAGNHVAKFDPMTSQFTEYLFDGITCTPTSPPGCDPNVIEASLMEDIEIASGESSIWFTAPGVNKVAEFVLTTETFGEDYPTTNIFGNTVYTPNQIVKDGSGNLWVSSDEGTIGRLLPATLQNFTWFIVASDTSEIGGLYWQQNGSQNEFWFTTSNTGFAGKLTLVSGIVVDIMRFAPGGTNGGIYGITAEADGTAWIANSNTNAIIEWKPPYFTNTYLPTILNP